MVPLRVVVPLGDAVHVKLTESLCVLVNDAERETVEEVVVEVLNDALALPLYEVVPL